MLASMSRGQQLNPPVCGLWSETKSL